MHSTLYELHLYDKGHDLKRKMIDEISYMMGVYNYNGLQTALHNFGLAFDTKHKSKHIDYLDKPFLYKDPVKKSLSEMTDEEIDVEIQKAILVEKEFMKNSRKPVTKYAKSRAKH